MTGPIARPAARAQYHDRPVPRAPLPTRDLDRSGDLDRSLRPDCSLSLVPALAAAVLVAATACAPADGPAAGDPAADDPADIVITGGTIVDGSGDHPRAGTVVIDGDVIRSVDEADGGAVEAADTIDATGLVVAPGFIDVHNHTPPALVLEEQHLNEGFVRQGVTTVFGGPDGGFAPTHIRQLTDAYASRGTGTNVAFYVGHNAIRNEVMGADQQRAPTTEELEEMRALVREGMELGAFGLSTGLMYEPGMFSETDEVIALAQEAAPYGGVYDSHVRNPVHDFVGSDREVVAIAERAG